MEVDCPLAPTNRRHRSRLRWRKVRFHCATLKSLSASSLIWSWLVDAAQHLSRLRQLRPILSSLHLKRLRRSEQVSRSEASSQPFRWSRNCLKRRNQFFCKLIRRRHHQQAPGRPMDHIKDFRSVRLKSSHRHGICVYWSSFIHAHRNNKEKNIF